MCRSKTSLLKIPNFSPLPSNNPRSLCKSLHIEFCKADRASWELTLQDTNTTPKEHVGWSDPARRVAQSARQGRGQIVPSKRFKMGLRGRIRVTSNSRHIQPTASGGGFASFVYPTWAGYLIYLGFPVHVNRPLHTQLKVSWRYAVKREPYEKKPEVRIQRSLKITYKNTFFHRDHSRQRVRRVGTMTAAKSQKGETCIEVRRQKTLLNDYSTSVKHG